jgi:uncharacterized protein
MSIQASVIMLGVKDVDRAKKFYVEGRGVSFHHLTDSRDAVDEVMRAAEAAGGTVVKAAAAAGWGGYFGYFSDPDGYLWKVATAS